MIIDDLVRGSIDMHCHHAPAIIIPGRMDALETARQARQLGMRALVLKSSYFPTAPIADIVNQFVPEVKCCGGICLDYEIGGLNVIALETSAKMGAKMVWMPTHSSLNSRANMRKLPGASLEGDGFSILDAENKPVPEIDKILSIVKQYDMVLANGHISPRETFALVEAAQKKGITKLVITHGLWTNGMVRFTLDELKQLGQMGAYIENCYVGFLPTDFRNDPKPMADAIKYIGAEHCIMSTDLGQYYNPSPAEGMRMFIALLLKYGISAPEIEFMAKKNPAKLLGLD
ncbi:MAG: DUF6282 family protein [Dehalococcoidales bacterium]